MSEASDLLKSARRLGFTPVRFDGKGHRVFMNADGVAVRVSSTPRNRRSWRWAIAEMAKISRRKPAHSSDFQGHRALESNPSAT